MGDYVEAMSLENPTLETSALKRLCYACDQTL